MAITMPVTSLGQQYDYGAKLHKSYGVVEASYDVAAKLHALRCIMPPVQTSKCAKDSHLPPRVRQLLSKAKSLRQSYTSFSPHTSIAVPEIDQALSRPSVNETPLVCQNTPPTSSFIQPRVDVKRRVALFSPPPKETITQKRQLTPELKSCTQPQKKQKKQNLCVVETVIGQPGKADSILEIAALDAVPSEATCEAILDSELIDMWELIDGGANLIEARVDVEVMKPLLAAEHALQ